MARGMVMKLKSTMILSERLHVSHDHTGWARRRKVFAQDPTE